MSDDELLAIYGSIRKLAESMEAREDALDDSTEKLDASIAQLRQLPATLGQQTSQYIAAGIKRVVQEDFGQPIEAAVKGPISSIDVAAYHARQAIDHLKDAARFRPGPGSLAFFAWGSHLGRSGRISSSPGRSER